MKIYEKIAPRPSEFKARFKHLGVPITHISNYLSLSYPYTVNLLNGVSRMSTGIEEDLKILVSQLESELQSDCRKEVDWK